MNPWPFVIAAYVVMFAGIAGLTLWSWIAMRRAERLADAMRRGS